MAYSSKPENCHFWVWNLETWKMKYQVRLEAGNCKPGFWNPRKIKFETHNSRLLRKMFKTRVLTAESCRKTKTNNQQLLRKLKLKYEVNLRFETRINVWPKNEKPENEKLNSRFTLNHSPRSFQVRFLFEF